MGFSSIARQNMITLKVKKNNQIETNFSEFLRGIIYMFFNEKCEIFHEWRGLNKNLEIVLKFTGARCF